MDSTSVIIPKPTTIYSTNNGESERTNYSHINAIKAGTCKHNEPNSTNSSQCLVRRKHFSCNFTVLRNVLQAH